MNVNVIQELAAQVSYQDVRDYLKSRGWTTATSQRPYAAIYRSPEAGSIEVVVPLERDLGDYADAMQTVAERVARFEKRDGGAVLRDLLCPKRDTLRFSLDSLRTKSGTIGLLDGASLIAGVKKALLASAASVQRNLRYFPRMSFAEAEAYVRSCTLGQTEVGSFVLTVEAPHDVTSQTIRSEGPFGRRSSERLFSATHTLATCVRKGDYSPILDAPEDKAIVSANLCDAILEILPQDQSADLRLQGSWSPMLPAPAVPGSVTIDGPMYEAIGEIREKLRPSAGPQAASFVGSVLELSGAAGASGRVEGEVTFWILHDEQILKARATLSPDDYRTAADAHLNNGYVYMRAVLHPGRRVNQLREVSDFRLLSE